MKNNFCFWFLEFEIVFYGIMKLVKRYVSLIGEVYVKFVFKEIVEKVLIRYNEYMGLR